MKNYTTTELARQAPKILAQIGQEVISITRHGKPLAVIMTWEAYESLLDTFDILVLPVASENVRRGMADLYANNTVPWEKVQKELDSLK